MKTVKDKIIIVGPVRLSYLNAFKPRENVKENGDVTVRYSTSMLLPKGAEPPCDPAEAKKLNAAITEFGNAAFPNYKGWNNPLKDGDKEKRRDNGEPKNPGYWYCEAWSKDDRPPAKIDKWGKENIDPSEWNSGDYANVKIALWTYDTGVNKGVGLGLRGIQFLAKGEPLGGDGGNNADGFDVSDEPKEDNDPFAED